MQEFSIALKIVLPGYQKSDRSDRLESRHVPPALWKKAETPHFLGGTLDPGILDEKYGGFPPKIPKKSYIGG